MIYVGNDIRKKGKIYSDFKCPFCGKVIQVRKDYGEKRYSCGCIKSNSSVEGDSVSSSKYHFIYSRYKDILKRCYNTKSKAYKNYGGRGIKICDEWKNNYLLFKKWFLKELDNYVKNNIKENLSEDEKLQIAKKLSIDRINVNGNYEPNNCRLATYKLQARNTRINVLNEERNNAIRDLHNLGYSCCKLARIFNTQHSTICRMLKGETWAD